MKLYKDPIIANQGCSALAEYIYELLGRTLLFLSGAQKPHNETQEK